MPVVIALRSILARSMMSPHFGHICALIQRFSRLIKGSQIQQVVHSAQLLRNDHVLIRDSLKLPESSIVLCRNDKLRLNMVGDLPSHSVSLTNLLQSFG
jgi:hypothetical protein